MKRSISATEMIRSPPGAVTHGIVPLRRWMRNISTERPTNRAAWLTVAYLAKARSSSESVIIWRLHRIRHEKTPTAQLAPSGLGVGLRATAHTQPHGARIHRRTRPRAFRGRHA